MSKVVVIGAGAMGLATAYQAVLDGHEVDLVEAAPEAGGMAGHFDFGGLSIERFYHFVSRCDHPTFQLLEELGLGGKIVWVPTSMGFLHEGRLNRWGDPVALLTLPGVSLLSKLRYGLLAFISVKRERWDALDTVSAKDWIIRWCGQDVYNRFWQPLLTYKFYEYADRISAEWIWRRIWRIGRSRKSMMQEELGYIDGGSKTLVDALVHAIEKGGGRVRLNAPVQQVTTQDGRVTGVQLPDRRIEAEHVISTVPTPYVTAMVPDLPQAWKEKYRAIHNIGVICIILKLKTSISPYFWINISEPDMQIPGVIEFSNLRKVSDVSIVYVPYYMPVTHEKFSWSDERLVQEAVACLQRIRPTFDPKDVIDAKVARLRHGQPVCDVGFSKKIPPVQTPIAGLQIADTCFYYPEDRGIAESIQIGRKMARQVSENHA